MKTIATVIFIVAMSAFVLVMEEILRGFIIEHRRGKKLKKKFEARLNQHAQEDQLSPKTRKFLLKFLIWKHKQRKRG